MRCDTDFIDAVLVAAVTRPRARWQQLLPPTSTRTSPTRSSASSTSVLSPAANARVSARSTAFSLMEGRYGDETRIDLLLNLGFHRPLLDGADLPDVELEFQRLPCEIAEQVKPEMKFQSQNGYGAHC